MKRARSRDGIYKRPGRNGPVWCYTITHHGLRERVTVGPVEAMTREEVATARNLRIATLIRDDHEIPRPRVKLRLETLKERFLETLPEGSDRRAKADRYLGHVCRVLGKETAVESVTVVSLVGYRKARLAEKIRQHEKAKRTVQVATVNREISGLRVALRWATRQGLIRTNPFERMEKAERRSVFGREEARTLPTLDDEALDKLLAALPERARRPTEFALLTGLRREEALGLDWSHVHEADAVPFVRPTKTKSGKARIVPLSDRALALLPERPKEGGLVWGRVSIGSRAWHRARKAADVPGFRFHDLRHVWATRCGEAGMDARTLMEIAGWSDLSLAVRYCNPTPERALAVLNRVSNPVRNVVPFDTNRAQGASA